MNSIQAKQIKIIDYLHSLGIHPHKVTGNDYWYHSPFRQEQTPSFKVNSQINAWHDFGSGEKGNILDLVMKLHSILTISGVLAYLSGKSISTLPNRIFFFSTARKYLIRHNQFENNADFKPNLGRFYPIP